MADLTVTASVVARAHDNAEIYNGIAAETITAGQVVYLTSSGAYGVASANVAGKQQARGVALGGAAAGQAFSFIKRGFVSGFTISQAYDTKLFVSNTLGAIADAAGTLSVPAGRVMPMADASLTKVAFVDFAWETQF
jgi:L-serine deaminase